MTTSSELLRFAEDLARRAGKITLNYFSKELDVQLKADESPVTIADRETEAFIRAEIERRFPDHGILGEEEGSTRADAPFQWIIDPIDGTKSFIRGVPMYGVMIALEENGQSRLGVIYHPPQDVLISAEVGGGTHLNGHRVQVRDACSIKETCVLSTNFVPFQNDRPDFYRALVQLYPFQRTWGDCFGYTMVASGRAQAMMDAELSHWDFAALKPIIEEAGGIITDLNGSHTNDAKHCLAATPRIHAEILSMLAKG